MKKHFYVSLYVCEEGGFLSSTLFVAGYKNSHINNQLQTEKNICHFHFVYASIHFTLEEDEK